MGHEKKLADIDDIQLWLRPQCERLLNDLNLGSAASRAAERWRSRLSFGNVIIYGDYDTDGISSTVLAMEIFRHRALGVRYFIPRRDMQGYGLHTSILDRLAESGCNTLVVVDCGTNDAELLNALSRKGMEIFVFDHHSVNADLVPFSLTVNPYIDGNEAARKLCATAVLWSWAWKEQIVSRDWLRYSLDLVALATISDCMPLDSLNRALVQKGMALMRNNPRRGLAALFEKLGVSRQTLAEEQLSMRVIPCLNAPGRIGCADVAVRVLLGAGELCAGVGDLIKANRKRQALSESIADRICEAGAEKRHVMYDKSWPVGVLSGVASRICSIRKSPVALAAPVGGKIRGTLRVPVGGNAVHILSVLSERLEGWGGHRYAAGFSVLSDRWAEVESSLEELLSGVHIEEELLKAVVLSPAQISLSDWKNVGELGPFGNGNPCPCFYRAKGSEDRIVPLGRDGRHSAVVVDDVRLLAFNAAADLQDASLAENVRGWLYHPRIDHWRNEERVQFVLDCAVLEN
jgi:single-stranded-DNA-specific exonuclease